MMNATLDINGATIFYSLSYLFGGLHLHLSSKLAKQWFETEIQTVSKSRTFPKTRTFSLTIEPKFHANFIQFFNF